jgi:multimeric flavodoxin WrbA
MNALVLNGANNKDSTVNTVSDYVVDLLRINHYDTEVLALRNLHIEGCRGCFACWLKTPGECIIHDDAFDLPRKVIGSDIVFLLSPVTFGMYSSSLKKALDRFPLPLLLPFFKHYDGEIHHPPRYQKYPKLVTIGVLPKADQESETTFATLAARNSINLHTTTTSSFVYSSDDSAAIKKKVASTLSKAGIS